MAEFKFNKELFLKLLAELLGTAMVLALGCTASVLGDETSGSLAWGLSYLAAIHIFSFVSGAHFNPAVSATATIVGAMHWKMMLFYMLAQLVGACLGCAVAFGAAPKGTKVFCYKISAYEDGKKLGMELVFMMALLFAYCAIWDKRSEGPYDSQSVRIGFIYAGMSCASMSFSGGHLNFVRSLAVSIVNLSFGYVWPPLIGHALAVGIVGCLWRFLLGKGEPEKIEQVTI